jgi:hypothetical protein
MLSGSPRPHAILPRLAPAAVRPGGADLHAGDAADAVLDMGGMASFPRCGCSPAAPLSCAPSLPTSSAISGRSGRQASAPRTAPDRAGRTARR